MDKTENRLHEIYSKTVLPKLKTLEPLRKKMVNFKLTEKTGL